MTVQIVKAVVKLRHVSLLGRDTDENTFVFWGTHSAGEGVAGQVKAASLIPNFYNATRTHAGANGLASYIAEQVDRTANAMEVDYYDITAHLDGSSTGTFLATERWTLDGSGEDAHTVPAECGLVATLYGVGRPDAAVLGPVVSTIPTSPKAQRDGAPATHTGRTHPKQSHTGRLYLGPVNNLVFNTVGGEVRARAFVTSDVKDACVALQAAGEALTTPVLWSVWSRRLATTFPIFGGHIDDAPDIQRRRGVAASARSTWSV